MQIGQAGTKTDAKFRTGIEELESSSRKKIYKMIFNDRKIWR